MFIPEHTKTTIDLWVAEGIPTGGFLERVINNHGVVEVIGSADNENQVALTDIVKYIGSLSGVPKFYNGAMRDWVNQKRG